MKTIQNVTRLNRSGLYQLTTFACRKVLLLIFSHAAPVENWRCSQLWMVLASVFPCLSWKGMHTSAHCYHIYVLKWFSEQKSSVIIETVWVVIAFSFTVNTDCNSIQHFRRTYGEADSLHLCTIEAMQTFVVTGHVAFANLTCHRSVFHLTCTTKTQCLWELFERITLPPKKHNLFPRVIHNVNNTNTSSNNQLNVMWQKTIKIWALLTKFKSMKELHLNMATYIT